VYNETYVLLEVLRVSLLIFFVVSYDYSKW